MSANGARNLNQVTSMKMRSLASSIYGDNLGIYGDNLGKSNYALNFNLEEDRLGVRDPEISDRLGGG